MLGSIMAAALTGTAIVQCQCHRARDITPVSERDARTAAEQLLVQKLSGPRYFSVSYWETGEPWITVDDARAQVQRVAAARQLDTTGQQTIRQLIDDMSEPHPHRIVGGERVRVSRLNLSLDTLK